MHEHRSLIVLDDRSAGLIEHTCVCWLPMYGRQGKLDVNRHADNPTGLRAWSGLGENPRLLERPTT